MTDEEADIAERIQKSEARKNFKKFGHKYLCATSEQYRVWVQAARGTSPPPCWFCTDCTPAYQSQMLKENRCLHPEIKFRDDPDDPQMTEGYVETDYHRKKREQNRSG